MNKGNSFFSDFQYSEILQSAFTIDDIDSIGDPEIDNISVDRLLHSGQLIRITPVAQDDTYFISENTLYNWYCNINIRLASAKIFRLKRSQFASLLSQLRKNGRWYHVPDEVIAFGQKNGLINVSANSEYYVFSLARILSQIKNISRENVINMLLCIFEDRKTVSIRKLTIDYLKESLSSFEERIIQIIKCRESLVYEDNNTLQMLGEKLNLTRERIRQLEKIFWDSIILNKFRIKFIKTMLCDLLSESGCLIFKGRQALHEFLAKCTGIPFFYDPTIDMSFWGIRPKQIVSISKNEFLEYLGNPQAIHDHIENQMDLWLSKKDIECLVSGICKYQENNCNLKYFLVYALRKIGKPAHYSEITLTIKSIWPSKEINERSVHNRLGKEGKDIVWVGIKGTFALREWGFERPSKTLFETVAEIVGKKYAETDKPVALEYIVAEFGKYRKVVHPHSLFIALHSSPGIKRFKKGFYVPRDSSVVPSSEATIDELDEVLQEYKNRNIQ